MKDAELSRDPTELIDEQELADSMKHLCTHGGAREGVIWMIVVLMVVMMGKEDI